MKIIVCAIACLVLIGCADDPVQKRVDREYPQTSKALYDVLPTFTDLLGKGALPGLTKDDMASLEVHPLGDEASMGSYPRSANVEVESKSSPDWLLYYEFQQKTQNAKWELINAWKQNKTNGEKTSLMSNANRGQ